MTPSRNPLLIVPVKDRRQRRRIMTIKHCAMTMLGVAVVFASISIYFESRRGADGDYGRLFGSQVAKPNPVSSNAAIVHEGAVADQAAPDPMLVAPGAREQLLMANSNVDLTPLPVAAVPPARTVVVPANGSATHGTAIVGDSNGIVVAHPPASSTAPPPPLSGGIFKQE
ncbi:MAG: hypothetical protein QOC81_4556 [Thermoanaerobaculia bacterium]|jgi:hypothetical protein|nr:hypothetical protein [Thermoanaerobaculia bacterium]